MKIKIKKDKRQYHNKHVWQRKEKVKIFMSHGKKFPNSNIDMKEVVLLYEDTYDSTFVAKVFRLRRLKVLAILHKEGVI